MTRAIALLVLLGLIVGVWTYLHPVKPILDSQKSAQDKTPAVFSASSRPEALVTKIVDGDTFVIEGGQEVRMLGVDTDEYGHPCFAEAKDRMEYLLLGQKVMLERDGSDKDQYGRLLRFVFLDGKNVNLELVTWGLAVARFVGNQTSYKTEITHAEQAAIANHIGCKWSALK